MGDDKRVLFCGVRVLGLDWLRPIGLSAVLSSMAGRGGRWIWWS